MKRILPAFLALAAVGCAASGYMRDTEPTPPPGPDEVKVLVYRTAVIGGIEQFPIYAAQEGRLQLMGFTETDRYFEARLAPGRTVFIASGEGDALIQADLVAGHTYILQAWSKIGLVTARPGFAPVAIDSEAWMDLEAVRSHLQARELDPEKAETARQKTIDRATLALTEYEGGTLAARKASTIHAVPPGGHGQ